MIESSVYWEAHVHSLKALQRMDLEGRSQGPELLQHMSCLPNTKPFQLQKKQQFDVSRSSLQYNGAFRSSSIYTWDPYEMSSRNADVLSRESATAQAPNKTSFTFDATQEKAFFHIFNSAAPIVQGPPGTGKSFIGVAAAKSMMEDYALDGPILVVCYTNHALDSFLLDLLKVAPKTKLIRLGAQSKSEELSRYKLGQGFVKGMGFDAARKELEACWNDSRLENFIPSGPDIPNSVTQYFQQWKEECLQVFKEWEQEVRDARLEQKTADNEVPDWAISEVASGLKKLNKQYNRLSVTQCTNLLWNHRKDDKDAKEVCDLLKDYPNAVYFALNEITPRQKEACEWLSQSEAGLAAAKAELKNFLLVWRDAKGKANTTVTVTEIPDEHTVEEEEELGEDIAELNADQLQEETAGDLSSPHQTQTAPKHQHKSIRTVTVTRPTFLDESMDCDALNARQRNELYDYFADARLRDSQPTLLKKMIEVNDAASMRKAAVADSHGNELRRAQVIGATTTGLSKHLLMMASAKVRCVILEEAAEIPECHALAALLPDVRHFIQIGDHQQLRPKISCHGSRKLNLNISLMERMINVNNSCKTLAVQRRMRTEIADFIRPFYDQKLAVIGTSLRDHECTESYPTEANHYGLDSRNGFVLYVDHEFPESESKYGTSYENFKEAEYAVAVALYISKQQPKASITILVPYIGQLLCVGEVIREKKFSSLMSRQERTIRVVSIDDFQGEESDVVILCLTRSRSPGFFREDNRICVALSRARHLQIVVGNFKCFKDFTESVWPSIFKRAMETPAGIRKSLRLECSRHHNEREFAVGQDPFLECMSPLCGCKESCGMKRSCGHICESLCHANASCESTGKCTKPCHKIGVQCGRPSTCQHECVKRCFEDCGHCFVPVQTHCQCGKEITVDCYQFKSDSYYQQCKATFVIDLACGHRKEVGCYEKHVKGNIICEELCKKKHTDCNHTCRHKCNTCFEPNHIDGPMWVHAPCIAPCKRPLVCGHLCQNTCSNICPPCVRECEYSCEHHKTCLTEGKAHQCGLPDQCVLCEEPCQNNCEHSRCNKRCHQVCDRKPCDLQCELELSCGHRCRGICGEPCLSRCFECKPWDDDVDGMILGNESAPDVNYIELKCGHFFEVGDLDSYFGLVTDFTRTSIAYPKCPQCSSLIVNVKRYKGKLNEIRLLVNKVKQMAIDRQEEGEKRLKEAQQVLRSRMLEAVTANEKEERAPSYINGYSGYYQSTTKFNPSASRPSFTNVPSLKAAILMTEQQINRLKSAGQNLQLSASLCHRIELLFLIYGITTIDSQYSSDGPEGNKIMNAGINELTSLVGNSTREEMDAVIRQTFKKILGSKNLRCHGDDITELAKAVCNSRPRGLTDEDKRSIHSALVSSKTPISSSGAYKKCPCGYIYVIGDCGGAMVTSTCPECRRTIGGGSHRDVDGVTHTGEFDGSSRAAWS